MSPQDEDLTALKKIWYQKLKDSGFEDIEDTDSSKEYLKEWHSTYWNSHYSLDAFEERINYYRMCSLFLHEYAFKTDYEREVWSQHTEGKTIRETVKHLTSLGIKRQRTAIHHQIQKFVRIMKLHYFEDKDE